jgi:hypothetical protein
MYVGTIRNSLEIVNAQMLDLVARTDFKRATTVAKRDARADDFAIHDYLPELRQRQN